MDDHHVLLTERVSSRFLGVRGVMTKQEIAVQLIFAAMLISASFIFELSGMVAVGLRGGGFGLLAALVLRLSATRMRARHSDSTDPTIEDERAEASRAATRL